MDASATQKNLLTTNGTKTGNSSRYFLLAWLVVNLVQIGLTELTSDEGYYWFYAQHLQWGYYDHPPMIALLIKMGTALFKGELSVRFFNVLLSTGGLYLFLTLLPVEWRSSRKTWLLILSAPLLHYLCFIVFPDGPLLFFSLAFLAIYKRFLIQSSYKVAILLGLAIAVMAWSKYHGALVVLFTVIANPQLLRTKSFYLALAIAFVLFFPHLWWQYQNHFPTFKYHLSGRTGTLSFKHVGEYLSQQLVAIGPGLIFIPFVVKASDVFERTLKVIIIGSFIFFLATSFKTFVHFHWTSIAVFPILYFAVRYYHQPQKTKLFNSLIVPFVLLFVIIRLLLAVPLIPAMHVGEDYYQGRKAWAKEIQSVAGNRPVLMPDNLREASLYSFYSGEQGIALYGRPEKKSQYELWGYEDSLQGKEVMLLTKYPFTGSQPLPNSLRKELHYALLPNFSSYYNGVVINVKKIQQEGDSVTVQIVLLNNRTATENFASGLNGELATLVYSLEKDGKVLKAEVIAPLVEILLPGGQASVKLSFSLKDVAAGKYDLFFGIRNGILPDAILSEKNLFQKN